MVFYSSFFVLAACRPGMSVWEQPFDRREVKARVEAIYGQSAGGRDRQVEVLSLEEYPSGR